MKLTQIVVTVMAIAVEMKAPTQLVVLPALKQANSCWIPATQFSFLYKHL